MLAVISKVDPKKTVEIGGYRLDVGRNDRRKTVQLSKSETYLTDLMETICKSIALSHSLCFCPHRFWRKKLTFWCVLPNR